MKESHKHFKKNLKKIFSKQNLIKIIVIISGLMLILTSFLPYIL